MNRKIRLIWQLYPSYVLIILVSLFAVGWNALSALKTFYIEQTITYLKNQGQILSHEIGNHITPLDTQTIDKICKAAGKDASIRITIMLLNGDIIGDSHKPIVKMDNHADRPEVFKAATGNIGSSIRFSRTLQKNMMYVAVPLKKNNITQVIIRTSIPLTFIETSLKTVEFKIFINGLLIAFFASLVCLYISRRISRPIEEIRQGAEQFAKGDFSLRIHMPHTNKELTILTDSLNEMAAQLDERIKTVLHQQNEIEAILSSMLEGIIAIDTDEQIIKINHTAIKMLDQNATLDDYLGRNIQEIIRIPRVHKFVNATLFEGQTIQGDIEINYKERQVFNICCTPLRYTSEIPIGALIVFNDVTQLRHLENVRQDFVANVSHEIRTPLTTIKGFVETLLSGAMKDSQKATRFLGIINKHVARLNGITENLLQLARIEQNGTNQIHREKENLKRVILSAIQICQEEANNKHIQIKVSCDSDLFVNIHRDLFEHSLVNLLDNAIKYSKENSEVNIAAEQKETHISIKIIDQGQGIAKEHLTRLFERFYRVDKARSRDMGGTGLGLSIVKHIVQAHDGNVKVDSTLGKGSVFTIDIRA
jgi:two-component system phosphate regulon sensor histidine kinase PhoR